MAEPTIENIDAELTELEASLATPSASSGRAVFNSIASSLTNLGRRLDRALTSSVNSANERLRHRLSTAQLAHSSRRPLEVVRRQAESSQSQIQQNQPASTTTSSSSTTSRPQFPPNPTRLTASSRLDSGTRQHRPSVLMASRARSVGALNVSSHHDASSVRQELDEELFSKELHEATQRVRHNTSTMDVLKEEKRESFGSSTAEDVTMKEDEEDQPMDDTPRIPTKVLVTRSQSEDGPHSAMLSGSIVSVLSSQSQEEAGGDDQIEVIAMDTTNSATTDPPPDQLPGTIAYSWGPGLQSLHDDDTPRTPIHSRLASSSRLNKPNAPSLISVATGVNHSVSATVSGKVYSSGKNEKGCVDPTSKETDHVKRPRLLESITNIMGQNNRIVQISCGLDHTAAVTAIGTVLSWGSNQCGQLGRRMTQQSQGYCAPQGMILSGGKRAFSVACGHYFSVVLTDRMCVLACGVDYIAPGGSAVPVCLPALQGLPLVSVAAGHNHAVALTCSGTAYAWGINEDGCCGRPYPKQFHVPVEIRVPDTESASNFRVSTCSSTAESSALTTTTSTTKQHPFRNWGKKWQGSDIVSTEQQQQISFDGDCYMKIADDVAIRHVACGEKHTVMVTKSGRLLVCGSNEQGQLGMPLATSTVSPAEPVLHPESGGLFVSAEAGTSHTLLLDSRGDVWQMGGNKEGAELVLAGKSILRIAAGGESSIALAQGAETPAANNNNSTKRRMFSITEPNRGAITADAGNSSETTLDVQERSLALANNLDELVESLAAEAKTNNSNALGKRGFSRELAVASEIANRAEELLTNPAVMNSLFFGPRELDQMHSKLMSIGGDAEAQQTILKAIERGIKNGLESLMPENPDQARMIYPEAVRCLLVYIRFFDRPADLTEDDDEAIFDAFDRKGALISGLMEMILSLPYEGYKAFLRWATSIYAEEDLYIKMLVRPLLFQLEKSCRVKVDQDQVMHTSLSIGAVPLIVSVLQWLYNASERLDIAKPDEFVSPVFDKIPVEALYHDLSQLKKARQSQEGVKQFYICESPFLFSPSTKRNLLKMENQIEMYKAAYADGVSFNMATGEITVDAFFKMELDRDKLLDQALDIIKKTKPSDLRKSLKVKFRGEEGIDAGGVTKEFFQLLSEELFGVGSAMWTDKYGEDVTWFNSDCVWEDVRFELTGVLVGLALYNSVLLDVHFPMAVYRKLLGYPLGLEDMVDLELKRGFQQLLNYEGDDVEDIFCLTFEVTWTDDLGEERKRELKPGGSDIPVTGDNKEEYVRLYVAWLLVDSIYPQWAAFETGVLRVLEGSSIGLCRPEEVELLVVGSPELDFDALEANTEYEGGYDKESATIQSFWRFIKSIDRDSQTNFLKFATGSPKAPVGGLGQLKFKIQRCADSPQLPTSHTCFNTLILPDYGTDEKVAERLGRAIVECEGFGLE